MGALHPKPLFSGHVNQSLGLVAHLFPPPLEPDPGIHLVAEDAPDGGLVPQTMAVGHRVTADPTVFHLVAGGIWDAPVIEQFGDLLLAVALQGPLEDLLSDGTLSPKHANKISIIHDSATRLLNLINRILEFRKTETQNRKLAVARGNLAQLVQEIGLRYKELNPNNKVAYHIHIETEDAELFYDADMVTIILDNLLSNAVKYTSEGEITLTLRSVEEMQIKYTEISVKDTGHGIEPEALPHIFDRYYQAKSKFQASGSGIGLALVKGLTDLHEGMLKVESTPEVGTTFILRLLRAR